MPSQIPEEDQYLNPTAAVPKYFHFATVICERYRSAPVGTVLPALTELARRFSVSKETINRSMRYLATRGYVKSERGRGTTIVRDLGEALGLPPLSADPGPRPQSSEARGFTNGPAIGLILKSRSTIPSPEINLAEIEIIGGLQHRLQEAGIALSTVVVNESGAFGLEQQLEAMPGIGGFVFMTQMLHRDEAEQVSALKRPTVILNEDQFADLLTCIIASEDEGVEAMIRHLYGLGHRRVVYLARGDSDLALLRYHGFEKALQRAEFKGLEGITHNLQLGEIDTEKTLREQTAAILEAHPEVTAYLSGGTEISTGLCLGLRDLGKVPGREISVAAFGYGEHQWNSIAEGHDKVTTVMKPRYEMGRCAAEVLIRQLQQKYEQTGVIKVPTSILEGTTTGPLPKR